MSVGLNPEGGLSGLKPEKAMLTSIRLPLSIGERLDLNKNLPAMVRYCTSLRRIYFQFGLKFIFYPAILLKCAWLPKAPSTCFKHVSLVDHICGWMPLFFVLYSCHYT